MHGKIPGTEAQPLATGSLLPGHKLTTGMTATSGFGLPSKLERPPHWPQKCRLSRQVVSGDRFSYIEI